VDLWLEQEYVWCSVAVYYCHWSCRAYVNRIIVMRKFQGHVPECPIAAGDANWDSTLQMYSVTVIIITKPE